MQEKQRITIVVDRKDSALGTSATNRAHILGHTRVIEALSFSTPCKLIDEIINSSPDCILFTWRFVAWELMVMKSSQRSLASLVKDIPIGILIPDHIEKSRNLQREKVI